MRKKRLISIIALVLAALLVGGAVFSAVVGAFAEELPRDRYELTMEYYEEGQALHVTQRLFFTNRAAAPLRDVVFYAAGNMFRRESSLMYEAGDLETVFFAGYAPGGIDLLSVRVNGEAADYGFQGDDELYLRVECGLEPGETGLFEFEYNLLLLRCGAFMGIGDTDVRLSAFCFIPGVYDEEYGEFTVNRPLPHARWLYTGAADYVVTLTLPQGFALCATGEQSVERIDGDARVWRVTAENVRELALSFGRRYRESAGETASGVRVRVLENVRGGGRRALNAAIRAIEQCEAWFGAFPVAELDIAQSDYSLGALGFPGVIWLPGALLERGGAEELARQLRVGVARQYFGFDAFVNPTANAWLSDSVCEYLACLMLEAEEGHEALVSLANREWASALQLTLPGGLNVTSDASLFDGYAYDVVVRARGAVVFHELREAMGVDALLEGLAIFHDMGKDGRALTAVDLVDALNQATGGDWKAFLTDTVYNIDEYVNQSVIRFD